MNTSVYFLLASAAFLVVSAQEGSERARETFKVIDKSSQENLDASVFKNATSVLQDGFREGTRFISSSEDKIMNGISEAEKIFNEDPEAAKAIMEQAFSDAKEEIFKSVRDYFQSFGEAVALSNYGSKEGLGNASQSLQKAGFSVLEGLNVGKNSFDQGIDAGGNASLVLLKSVRLAVETGYAGGYHNIQKSIKIANQALRDAQKTPIQEEDENQNCESATEDPEGSKAVEDINEAANDALTRGANAELVERFQNVVICKLGDIVKVTTEGRNTVTSLKDTIETDPEGAKKTYAKQADEVKKVVHAVTAGIYLILGEVALESGNELKYDIGQAIMAMEFGKIQMFLGVDTFGDLLDIGTEYQGDAPKLAIDVSYGYYAKLAYIQAIVKAAQLVLGVL